MCSRETGVLFLLCGKAVRASARFAADAPSARRVRQARARAPDACHYQLLQTCY